ncbi:MAG: electron transfer flavoprotein subunit beta/FixA family protein, partial [Limnochordia bacterium]
GEGRIGLESDMGDWIGRLETRCPCLLTVTKGVGEPRLPSFRRKLATKDWPVTIWSAADLPAPSEQYYGLAGSPTQVERIFPPQVNDETFLWEGNPDTLAQKAYAKLAEFKLWG